MSNAKSSRFGEPRTLVMTVGRSPWLWQGALMLFAIWLTATTTWATHRDFWYDEAMLVQAIRLDDWLAPWQPMTHFEQASPWGVYLIQKASLSLVGFHPNALRVPGLTAYAIGGLTVWAAARLWLGGTAPIVAGVVTVAGLDAVQLAGDFKHYTFEYAVAGSLILLTVLVRRGAPLLVLLVGAVLALAFSNTVVFVMPGLALVLLMEARTRRRRIEVVATTGIFLIAWAAWFVLAVRPATVFQLAYPTYVQATPDQFVPLVENVAQPNATYFISVTFTVLVGAGIALLWRRQVFLLFVPAIVAVALATIGVVSGKVPFTADRHLLFLVPLLGLALAGTLRTVSSVAQEAVPPRGRRPALASAAVAAVVVFGTTITITPNAQVLRQQTGTLLQSISATCPSYVVDWWTQPTAQLYADALNLTSRLHGVVSTTSGLGQNAWAYRVRDHPGAYQKRVVDWVRANPTACILSGDFEGEDALVFAPLRNVGMTCTTFASQFGIHATRCSLPTKTKPSSS